MKILIIDDEKGIRTSLKFFLKGEGFEIETAETGEEGIEKYQKFEPDITILDINLPGIDGLDVLSEIKRKNKKALVIMITYRSEVKLAVHAMKLGAYDYFMKPFNIIDIKNSVVEIISYLSAKKNTEAVDRDTTFIGESKPILELKEKIQKLINIKMDTTILITGSSGTGKEVLGKYIHQIKNGDNRPFVAINCAAIPKSLQESEFFGYEKGAFTEAKARKIGLIEKSNGGTLFLDEVADMDIELQAKMLRVLQEKKFRRVGGLEEIPFSATVISATNKDLKKEIVEGNFRQDLYYRINVVPLKLPDLAKRKDDIPLLVEFFVKKYNESLDKNIKGFSQDAMNAMMHYSWDGNIRELKNMIERIMIFQDDEYIRKENLPEEIFHSSINDIFFEGEYIDKDMLNMTQANIIKKALEENNWNITHTADVLGISRLTLRKRMQKFAIEK